MIVSCQHATWSTICTYAHDGITDPHEFVCIRTMHTYAVSDLIPDTPCTMCVHANMASVWRLSNVACLRKHASRQGDISLRRYTIQSPDTGPYITYALCDTLQSMLPCPECITKLLHILSPLAYRWHARSSYRAYGQSNICAIRA